MFKSRLLLAFSLGFESLCTTDLQEIRMDIIQIQAVCRGFLARARRRAEIRQIRRNKAMGTIDVMLKSKQGQLPN